jgi:hypothetical protein
VARTARTGHGTVDANRRPAALAAGTADDVTEPIRAQTTGPLRLPRFDDNWPRTAHRGRGASKCQARGVFPVKVGGRRAVWFGTDRVWAASSP